MIKAQLGKWGEEQVFKEILKQEEEHTLSSDIEEVSNCMPFEITRISQIWVQYEPAWDQITVLYPYSETHHVTVTAGIWQMACDPIYRS